MNGKIKEKESFLKGENIWVDIDCKTINSEITELAVKWDKNQKNWEQIYKLPPGQIGDTRLKARLSHSYKFPGNHYIYLRCSSQISFKEDFIYINVKSN